MWVCLQVKESYMPLTTFLWVPNQEQTNWSAFTSAQTSLVFVHGTEGKLTYEFNAFWPQLDYLREIHLLSKVLSRALYREL
jgi:hypothetical protein